MPKLTILVFEEAVAFDAEEMKYLRKGGIELQVSCLEPPTHSAITNAQSKFGFFDVKAYHFNNSIPKICPTVVIFPENRYERAKVFSENFPDKIVFVTQEELQDEKRDNFYVARWSFIEEFIKTKLNSEKSNAKSTS